MKWESEDRALKMLGQPRGCASGAIASASQAIRLGAATSVLVDGQPVPFDYIFDPDDTQTRMTWFVSALVLQFSVQKHPSRINAIVDHLLVTVHETKEIPKYQVLYGAYPATANLFYVEIDRNKIDIAREFRPTRFYVQESGNGPERQQFPSPIVLDDQVPAQIALRFNAKTAGMYLVSLDAIVSCGMERESLPVMPPQWMLFEKHEEPPIETT